MAKWYLSDLISHVKTGPQAGLPDGRWVPARPVPFFWNLKERINCTWDVFTLKADAVYWDDGSIKGLTAKLGNQCKQKLRA